MRREEDQANATLALMAETGSDDRLKSFSALASGNPFGPNPELSSDGSISPAEAPLEVAIIGPGAARAAAAMSAQKNRTGKTTILAHKTALHALDGETGAGYYHQQMDDKELAQTSAPGVVLNAFTTLHLAPDTRGSQSSGGSVQNKKKRKESAESEPARSRQPSLAPPGMSLAAQRSRMKSVPNVGDRGYVSGSSMSAYQNGSASAGGSSLRAAAGERKASFQPAAGAQRSWVG